MALGNITSNITNNMIVMKSETEDFVYGTHLTVGPSQKAIFVNRGRMLDTFESGDYVLETSNIPLVGKALNLLYDGRTTPFHCSIYFVNLVEQMGIKWGTRSKITYRDPEYDFPIRLGMNGDMTIAVSDPAKLIVKIVGAEPSLSQDQLIEKLRERISMKLQDYVSNFMRSERINVYDAQQEIVRISEEMHKRLSDDFDDVGIELIRFNVSQIQLPEGDPTFNRFKELHYQKAVMSEKDFLIQQSIKDAQIEAYGKATYMDIMSDAERRKREREGYSWQQEQSFDVAKTAAGNEAIGQFTNMGIGLGVMSGLGNSVAQNVNGAVMSAGNTNAQAAPQTALPPQAPAADDPEVILTKLKSMLDKGLISQEKYDKKVEEILERM